MGSFLTILRNNVNPSLTDPQTTTNYLLNLSLAKLREFHGSFKSVCDIFSIDLTEFEQIFGKNEDSFLIWDTDNNGLIDALELFSGLILFAEAKFDEKIRFLFDLYDFNELNSLSLVDLEFMFISCCNATSKIYCLNIEADEDDISRFLNNYFTDESRINISQLLKWCTKISEIKEFFNIIRKEQPSTKTQSGINAGAKTVFETLGRNKRKDEGIKSSYNPKPIGTIINTKNYQAKLDWLSNLSKKIFIPKTKKIFQNDIIAKMNWVYGYRCHDVKRSIQYIPPLESKSATEKIVYFTACIAIVYYTKLNEQRHYVEHDKEIISLAISKNSFLIATGEYGEKPAVHIWNVNNLQTLGILSGVHQNGVHLLTFFENDLYLATCGIRENTPILIYSVKDFNLLLSTYVNDVAIDLFPINNYIADYTLLKNKSTQKKLSAGSSSMFVLLTSTDIICFTYFDNHFITNETNIKHHKINSKIKCGTALRLNSKNSNLSANALEDEKDILIVTGHKNGQVLVWRNFILEKELGNYKCEILSVSNNQNGIFVATDAATLIWFNLELEWVKNIDLTTFPFKLFNFNVCDLIVLEGKLMVTTTEGDVVEVNLQNKSESSVNIGQRINFITKLTGDMKAASILEKDEEDRKIFVAGSSSIVYGFSLETHEIVDIWNVGDNITALDSINFEDGVTFWAIGCANGKIFLRIDWEEYPKNFECEKQINDLKFSSDTNFLVAASEDGGIYVFKFQNSSYFDAQPKKVKFENETPISIVFCNDNKSILIGTSIRNQYKMDLHELKCKNLNQDIDKIICDNWLLRFPLHTKNYFNSIFPFLIGGEIKCFIGTDENGYVYFWKDKEQLETNCGGFLRGHASSISRILMTKSQDLFYTLGLTDNTMIEWKIEQPFSSSDTGVGVQPIQKDNSLKEDCLQREINYCLWSGEASDRLTDQFVLFGGTVAKNLNDFLDNPAESFDPTVPFYKQPPGLDISLEYVYGFLGYDKRRTLQYIHFYPPPTSEKRPKPSSRRPRPPPTLPPSSQSHLPISSSNPPFKYPPSSSVFPPTSSYHPPSSSNIRAPGNSLLPESMRKEILVSNKTLLPYDELHTFCERHFLYFLGRFVVIYNPLAKTQKIYQGHKWKVTAVTIHPSKRIIASGESSLRPTIHVWNTMNLEPYKILKTDHRNGIITMAFSRDGSYIFSVGLDKYYSIQVINWRTEETIAIRNSGPNPIFDLAIDPYSKFEFVTGGFQNVTIWEINNKNLLRKSIVNLNEVDQNTGTPCIITCVAYISFNLGSTIQSDILCANNFGGVGLVVEGKYISVKEDAHSKLINVLKITEIYEEKIIIITASEDETIKVWDTKFNLINTISMRKIGYMDDIDKTINIAPQSIDLFLCKNPKHESNSPPNPILLFSTRNGSIFEAGFSIEYAGVSVEKTIDKSKQSNNLLEMEEEEESSSSSSSGSEDNAEYLNVFQKKKNFTDKIGNFKFAFSLYMKNHASQIQNNTSYSHKKLKITLCPSHPIMFSIGEDSALFIWDTEKNSMLDFRELRFKPTAITFSPDGNLLAVGFIDGVVWILDAKIEKNIYGKMGEKYSLPKLDKLMVRDKEDRTAVLAIEFSSNGKMLAISYDNARSNSNITDTKLEREGSYITLFMNRSSENSSFISKDQSLYTKYTDIRIAGLQSAQEKDKDIAVYSMSFSEDENYLFFYCQNIDQDQVPNNKEGGTFKIWDIVNNKQGGTGQEGGGRKEEAGGRREEGGGRKEEMGGRRDEGGRKEEGGKKEDGEIIEVGRVWGKRNFPNSLNCEWQLYQTLAGNEDDIYKENDSNFLKPIMSCMMDLSSSLICGSTTGDLHLLKSTALYLIKDHLLEKSKDKMGMAKSYAAHTSFVSQIEFQRNQRKRESSKNPLERAASKNEPEVNFLFSTAVSDEVVLKWRFETESPFWELDCNHLVKVEEDTIGKKKFIELVKEILPLRSEIFETKSAMDTSKSPFCDLYLANILGRRAFDSNSNLFYDYDDRIIYIAGCNFVITSFQNEEDEDDGVRKHLPQEFIKIEGETLLSSSPSISCICLSLDRKLLCAGTVEKNAKIFVWDICSKTKIQSITIIDAVEIEGIKFAYDSIHISCIIKTIDFKQAIYLINTQTGQILGCATFAYSPPNKIKDLDFFPNSIYKFVTCGIRHMTVWNFVGGKLTYYSMEIENPKDLIEFKKDQPIRQMSSMVDSDNDSNSEEELDAGLKVTFNCVVFVQESIVTGTDDGNLYLSNQKKFIKNQNAHSHHSILSLYASKFYPMFVSGATDGRVVLWEITKNESNKFNFEKYFEYNIGDPQNIASSLDTDIKYHIQSLCIGSKFILAGTKSGDIYEIEIPEESEEKAPTKHTQDMVFLRLNCIDDDAIQSVAFSPNSDKFYTLSKRGSLSFWDLQSLTLIAQRHFNQETVRMVVCRTKPQIVIAFEKSVLVVKSEKKFEVDPDWDFGIKTAISDMKISFDEKTIAVALKNNATNNAQIKFFSFNPELKQKKSDQKDRNLNHHQFFTVENLSSNVEFLDFSTDDHYLVYKSPDEITIVDLSNLEKINTAFVEMDLEWCSDGLKASEKIKGIHSFYPEENPFLKVVRLGEKTIVVTDEMGTIRIFDYPCEGNDISYMRSYTDHLNRINNCVLSNDRNFLITTSSVDKCLILWRVIKMDNEEEVEEEKQEEEDND